MTGSWISQTMKSRLVHASLLVLFAACHSAPVSEASPAAEAAAAFLSSLTSDQRTAACAPTDDPSRTVWGFVPAQYPGVMFGDLDTEQKHRAIALLRTVLRDDGVDTVLAIVALEDVLRAIETENGQNASHRDPNRYWIQVFGVPLPASAWAFRLQGHHVSLHVAFDRGRLAGVTPMFLGANPHRIPSGPREGERVLAAEEDLGRELLAMLDDQQRAVAIVEAVAPPDIILGPQRTAADAGPSRGLAYAAMTAPQREALLRLVCHYVHREQPQFAEADLARMRDRGLDAITFAWAGGIKRGEGHYYRVQGSTFVIEYDNTQTNANHVHTCYRDLERDFGGDWLREHLARDHGAIQRSDL